MNDYDYHICIGSDLYDLMQAEVTGDTEKVKVIKAKMKKESVEHLAKEYKWMKENLSPTDYKVFCLIDKAYERHIGWTKDCIFYGSVYIYYWTIKDITVTYKDYEPTHLAIMFHKGLFDLCIWYSDESGHDQGDHTLKKDIHPKDVIKEIEAVKKQP